MGTSIIVILGKIYVNLEIEMDSEFLFIWWDHEYAGAEIRTKILDLFWV